MSDIDQFFERATRLLERLESRLPADSDKPVLNGAIANRWRHVQGRPRLQEVKNLSRIRLDDLQCLDRQKAIITRNTEQFLNGLPANNVLLWGPRGTGKSSLIKAVLNEYADRGLRLIEVERQHLGGLRGGEIVRGQVDDRHGAGLELRGACARWASTEPRDPVLRA